MLLALIIFVVGIVITAIVDNYEYREYKKYGCSVSYHDVGSDVWLIGFIFSVFFAFMVPFILGAMLYSSSGYVEKIKSTTPLQNIADGSSVRGTFFLGSGSVNGYPTYSWYEKTGPNAYERENVAADTATVHYTAPGEEPHYVYTADQHLSHGFFGKWAFDINTKYVDGEHYDFYVPKGSITQDFKLDAQ